MKGPPEPTDPFDMRGPGARLREAREAANISLDRIAMSLLLDPKIVEALEEDDFDRLPAPTFVRGYLRGYARVLGVRPHRSSTCTTVTGSSRRLWDRRSRKRLRPTPPISSCASSPTRWRRCWCCSRLWWHSQEDGDSVSAPICSAVRPYPPRTRRTASTKRSRRRHRLAKRARRGWRRHPVNLPRCPGPTSRRARCSWRDPRPATPQPPDRRQPTRPARGSCRLPIHWPRRRLQCRPPKPRTASPSKPTPPADHCRRRRLRRGGRCRRGR